MAVDSAAANSLIVPQISDMLVEPLAAASVVLNSGVTNFQSSEPLRIPTLTGDMSGAWVGENEEIPESDNPTFGEIELMPTSRKSIKTIVRVSNELVRMARTGVSGVLQRRIVTDVRDQLDDALLDGDGLDNSITGIVNQPGVTTGTLDASDPDSILDAIADLAAKEITANRIILSGADFATIRKLKDGNGRGLLVSDLSAGAAYSLHGVPVSVTNKLAAGTAIVADMSNVAVVRDEDARVTLDASRYLEWDQIAIRVVTRYDLGLIRPEGVNVLTAAAV